MPSKGLTPSRGAAAPLPARRCLSGLLWAMLTVAAALAPHATAQPSGGSQSGGDEAPAAVGFYTYSDGQRGRLDLALLPDQRFMLVTSPVTGPSDGVEGWYLLRDQRVLLSGGELEAGGALDGDLLRLNLDGAVLPFKKAGPAVIQESSSGGGVSTPAIKSAAPPDLPISFWYWVAALIPLVVLMVLLAGMHWEPAPAAAVALAIAVAIAMTLYELPLQGLAVATGKAIWDAFFVMYVVWPALVLYSVIKEAGAFERIEGAMQRMIRSRLLLILAVAWGFSSFIQGIVGEGVPLAITIPLMLQLRVRPVFAVLLPLLGRTWGNIFGSMGEGWLIALRMADIPDVTLTAVYTGVLLIIPNVLAGLAIAWIYGGWWAIKRGALALAVVAVTHGGVQLVLATFYPRIAGFAAASAGLLVFFLLAKWGPYTRNDEEMPDRIFKRRDEASDAGEAGLAKENINMRLTTAFAPYLALAALAVGVLVVTPVREFLKQFSVGFAFPGTSTGLGVQQPAEQAYGAFEMLIHPGTLIIAATLFTAWLYHHQGLVPARATGRVLKRALNESLPATTPFVALVLSAKVMEVSGMLLVLALGTAVVTGPTAYTFLAPSIGALGAFATSSTSGALVLFTEFQETAARALKLPVSLVVAAQMAGAAAGNALAALDILIGLLVIGKPRLLGKVLKLTVIWAVLTITVVGAGAVCLYWIGGGL